MSWSGSSGGNKHADARTGRSALTGNYKNRKGKTRDMSIDLESFPEAAASYHGISRDELPVWKKAQREKSRKFLRTKRSDRIHKEVLSTLQGFSSTSWAKERLSLLAPVADNDELTSVRSLVERSMGSLQGINDERFSAIKSLLRKIEIPQEPVPRYDSAIGLVAENDEIYSDLIENGLNRWCPIYTPSSLDPDSDLLVYIYEIGNLDIEGDNVLMVSSGSSHEAMIPDSVISFFRLNRTILEAARDVQHLRGVDTFLDRALELLHHEQAHETVDLREVGNEALKISNDHFTDAVKGLQLEGGAILQLLGTETPEVVRSRIKEAEKAGVRHFRELTGFHLMMNTSAFPFTLDPEDFESMIATQRSQRRKREFEDCTQRAKELSQLKSPVIKEIQSLLEFDFLSSIAGFVRSYSLHFPEMVTDGDEIILRQASHLKFALSSDWVKVDYHLGGEDNVVILTGANSGGKTTLLETMAQTFILARMGFPVCCQEAVIPWVEELFFHSRKAAMNAGAFESFLTSFIPVVKQGTRKLILADELEAITELDAGARIIATILSRVQRTGSFAVVVSHMSEEIGQRIEVRIDGIEARGLDENLELIVDRVPRIGYRARSTPELIVQRLHTLSKGEEQEIYGEILDNFREVE